MYRNALMNKKQLFSYVPICYTYRQTDRHTHKLYTHTLHTLHTHTHYTHTTHTHTHYTHTTHTHYTHTLHTHTHYTHTIYTHTLYTHTHVIYLNVFICTNLLHTDIDKYTHKHRNKHIHIKTQT